MKDRWSSIPGHVSQCLILSLECRGKDCPQAVQHIRESSLFFLFLWDEWQTNELMSGGGPDRDDSRGIYLPSLSSDDEFPSPPSSSSLSSSSSLWTLWTEKEGWFGWTLSLGGKGASKREREINNVDIEVLTWFSWRYYLRPGSCLGAWKLV